MATIRVGVGSFNIEDKGVGFGTSPTDGLGNLKVKGVTKTTDIKVSGASTLTRYSGFAADNIDQLENITLTSEVGTIGDIVVGVGTSVIISSASTVTVGTVESVSIGTHFSPPKGGIEDRGDNFIEGMMRFNTDFNTMEFYNGNEWRQFTYVSDVQNSPSSRGRVVCWGGAPVAGKIISYVNIASRGNAINFGESLDTAGHTAGMSNAIRGVFAGRTTPSESIEYITLASEGNSIDFGDLTGTRDRASGLSSSTRGIIAGGRNPDSPSGQLNIIEYIEIMTLGNALDFGDLTVATKSPSTSSNGTRGILAHKGTVAQLTISSKGNSVYVGKDFFNGEYLRAWLTAARSMPQLKFYCYSKSLHLFGTNVSIPDNFFLTASMGGKRDDLIHKGYFKRWAIVVNSEAEAIKKGIEHIGKPYKIDKDDSSCFKPDPFALLIHGTQKKGYFKNLK